MLTATNYRKGFLIDDEFIGGVAQVEAHYVAYVSSYVSGEVILARNFESLEPALDVLNQFERAWTFEAVGCDDKGCKNGRCGGCGGSP